MSLAGSVIRCVIIVALASVYARADTAAPTRAEVYREAAAMAAIGQRMFADPSLSASGRTACATCHSPAHAFGPPNGDPVQRAGPDLREPGLRAVPSLMYLQAAPAFSEHHFESEDEGDESIDEGPTGGLTWDGRADGAAAQAVFPLFSPFEMANASKHDVVAKARAAGYADPLRRALGHNVLDDDATGFAAILRALAVYQQDSATFYPYSSKYDAVLAGKATLTPSEQRGLDLFNDPAKGNCARCHISSRGGDGSPPQFTDYGLVAIGVPRNRAIAANGDPGYFDLGLCGPERTDFAGRTDYCGRFMTPTLRNVATRPVFFHNGVAHTLRDAVRFYSERDTSPEQWYPRNPDGTVRKFDDLQPGMAANVDMEAPF
ncbi:MAG TPA: cytochrome c peroxidase, partial [Acetobacteraceae bacterium]